MKNGRKIANILFLSDFVDQPIPSIVFDWSVYLFQCTFPINAEKESVSWDIPPCAAETLRYRVIYSTIYSTLTQSYFCVNKNSHFRSKKTRTRNSDESTNMSSFNDSGGEDGSDICNIFDLFADSGLSDQSGLSDDRLCFILCFVVAQMVFGKSTVCPVFFSAPPGP